MYVDGVLKPTADDCASELGALAAAPPTAAGGRDRARLKTVLNSALICELDWLDCRHSNQPWRGQLDWALPARWQSLLR